MPLVLNEMYYQELKTDLESLQRYVQSRNMGELHKELHRKPKEYQMVSPTRVISESRLEEGLANLSTHEKLKVLFDKIDAEAGKQLVALIGDVNLDPVSISYVLLLKH